MRRSLDGQQTELLRVTAKLGNFENKFKKDRVTLFCSSSLSFTRDLERFSLNDNNNSNNKQTTHIYHIYI